MQTMPADVYQNTGRNEPPPLPSRREGLIDGAKRKQRCEDAEIPRGHGSVRTSDPFQPCGPTLQH